MWRSRWDKEAKSRTVRRWPVLQVPRMSKGIGGGTGPTEELWAHLDHVMPCDRHAGDCLNLLLSPMCMFYHPDSCLKTLQDLGPSLFKPTSPARALWAPDSIPAPNCPSLNTCEVDKDVWILQSSCTSLAHSSTYRKQEQVRIRKLWFQCPKYTSLDKSQE